MYACTHTYTLIFRCNAVMLLGLLIINRLTVMFFITLCIIS